MYVRSWQRVLANRRFWRPIRVDYRAPGISTHHDFVNRIVLDSNVFLSDRRLDTWPYQSLKRLAEHNVVRIHVPRIVRSEVVANVADGHRRVLGTLKKARKEVSVPFVREAYSEALAVLQATAGTAAEGWGEELDAWVKRTGGEVHEIAGDHAQRVFDAYFARRPPFHGIEDRSDAKSHLPDAFILELVRDLAEEEADTVYVVTGDSRLTKACESVRGVKVHKHVEALLKTTQWLETVEDQENAAEARRAFWDGLVGLMRANLPEAFEEQLYDAVRDGVYGAIGDYLTVGDVDVSLEDVELTEPPSFHFDRMSWGVPGVYTLPFSGLFEGLVTYLVAPFESYGGPDDPPMPESIGRDFFDTGGREHHTLVERGATVDLHVEGLVTLELPYPESARHAGRDDLNDVVVRFSSVSRFEVLR